MMKREQVKKRLAIFLFVYFSLFASYYTTNTFTKCVGSLSKSGALNIAKWDVSLNPTSGNTFNIIAGNTSENLEDQTYTFTITNYSDVALSYNIVLSNVPAGVEVIFDNVTYYESSNVVSITNAGSFLTTDLNNTHTHSLTFIAPTGTASVINNEVDIDVDFVQSSL